LLIASLLLGAATGCFVFDEVDKAAAINNGPGDNAPRPAKPGSESAAAAKPAAGATAAAKPSAPAGKSWWESARSLTSEDSDAGITRCELGGRTEFMLRDDCLARGGVAK
jgi:hypothetical protein